MRQENGFAAALNGRRVPGSGAFEGILGDVSTKDHLIECKTTTRRSFSITVPLLEKIEEQAFANRKTPAFGVTFEEKKAGQKDWVLIPLHVFASLINALD